jgi:polysaccharide export outer membrane protein
MVAATSGCNGGFLPQNGPGRESIVNGGTLHVADLGNQRSIAYALVRLNQTVVSNLHSLDIQPAFDQMATTGVAPADGVIGEGDEIGVTIFESAGGGLFLPPDGPNGSSRQGNYVNLPTQQVDKFGNISVPFAGAIRAAGQTTRSVQNVIDSRLANRALEPQAIVTIIDRRSNEVSVLGDINTVNGATTYFGIDPGGERILGAIAKAGGPRYPSYETYVTLSRGGRTQRALLSDIAEDPSQNIELQPGDVIYLSHEPRYFLAVGAVGQASTLGPVDRRFSFGDTHLTMADAIAQAGWLEDDTANTRGVFLYRFENKATLSAIGVPVTPDLPNLIPTVYLVDMSDPGGIFYAKQIEMRAEDTIFVSDAPYTDVNKILNLILPGAYSAANINNATH